jgi:hypothetical protein
MNEDYRLTLLRLECLLLLGHDIRCLELYAKDGRRDKVIRSMGRVIERLETEGMFLLFLDN